MWYGTDHRYVQRRVLETRGVFLHIDSRVFERFTRSLATLVCSPRSQASSLTSLNSSWGGKKDKIETRMLNENEAKKETFNLVETPPHSFLFDFSYL